MQFLDIESGEYYLYRGRIVRALGKRSIFKPGRDTQQFVMIRFCDSKSFEVQPYTLRPVPKDVTEWNATMERPIGFRRLP